MKYYVEQIEKTVDIDTNGCYIGVDFGTTNSTLSYLGIKETSQSNVRVETIAYRESVEQTEYIPTVVTYNNKDKSYAIGRSAKNNIGKRDMESYDCFKLQLGQNFKKPLKGGEKTAEEITYTYLEELLNKFKKQLGITIIDKIVATIPETWFRESSNRTARENIRGIYEKLGYKREQIHLQSEPVAACAYYCWCYFEKLKKAYNGHIMVVDYGGGTLDVTLCQVYNGSEIKVLERCGAGEYKDTNGCAGVAFDEAVTNKICEKNRLTLDADKFSRLRNRFEQEKIIQTDKIEKYLKEIYYTDEDIFEEDEDGVFSIVYNEEDLDVTGRYMGKAFKEINSTPLSESINQMKKFFPVHNVDEKNGDVFQVLLIGGFSNFYGVEHIVRKAFGSESNFEDKRFGTYKINGRPLNIFERADRSLAVSKGAALIAADVISVDPVCPYNIGITVVKPSLSTGEWEDADVILLEKGKSLKNSMAPEFFVNKIAVTNQNAKLRMFMDDGRIDGKGMVRFALDRNCRDIFPNMDIAENQYNIGVSMDTDMVAFLHIKDSKDESIISLQSLIERISIRIIDN